MSDIAELRNSGPFIYTGDGGVTYCKVCGPCAVWEGKVAHAESCALPALLDRVEAVDRLIAEIERDREIAVRVGASAECSRLTQYLDLLRGKEDAS